MTRLEKECRMQALVTRREGIISDNHIQEACGYSVIWGIEYFQEIEDELNALAKEEENS